MSLRAGPALVGRRFLSVTGSLGSLGSNKPKLKNFYDWDWKAGWIRSSTSGDPADPELQLLLEFDDLSWEEREWFSVYSPNCSANFPQNLPREKKKDLEKLEKEKVKERKKKKRKTDSDSESDGEEDEEFHIFCVEDGLTVAHRPNQATSSSNTGSLYPALIFKPLVDKLDLFKTKKLPVEFLSDNKLVFQEYSHLKTITEWDPSIPGLAVSARTQADCERWLEEAAAQRLLLTTPSVLVGERLSVYRVEGTTQWYSAFIIGHNQETGEFTVTDDTVLEEHLESPELVQMRILGEGVVQAILRGESIATAPRRSRACAYRAPTKQSQSKQVAGRRNRRSTSASTSGKLKPRTKRRVSSESPKKTTASPDKKSDRRRKCEANSSPDSLSVATRNQVKSQSHDGRATTKLKAEQTLSDSVKSPLPIRLPTKCKPKTDSDSDSDSRSTKSSTSSSSKVSKVFKKTFKGKAIAIVKPFSNAVTEKKELEERLNLYEFGSDEDRENNQRNKRDQEESDKNNLNKGSLQESSDVSLSKSTSAISSLKGIKRLKTGKQGSLSARRLKSSPELKSVRVRVEKLRNSNSPIKSDKSKVRQQLAEQTDALPQSELNQIETSGGNSVSSENKASSSCSPSEAGETSTSGSGAEDTNNQQSLEKVSSESDVAAPDVALGSEGKLLECKSEIEESGDTSGVDSGVKLNNDKIIEIVKSELFSEPLPITKEPVKLEKSDIERNEDSCSLQRSRMEEDSRSDSGVSTLRSDGARSSGDERSGSRSSALSDGQTRPGSSHSAEPDIKIVGTVPARDLSASQFYPRTPTMADHRHNIGLPPNSLPYPGHTVLPQPSAAAILQYQQLAAAAALGISPDALLKQNYGGLAGHLLSNQHPATELLLERERQIAQERDRALRERRDQEQRERERLDKERREREERERKEREKIRLKEERDRQAMEDVNRHFELSIEFAKKKMGGATGNWSNLPGTQKHEEQLYDPRRLRESQSQYVRGESQSQYVRGESQSQYVRGPPPPAHSSLGPGKAHYSRVERERQYRGQHQPAYGVPPLSRHPPSLVSPSAKSDPGQCQPPPPAHSSKAQPAQGWPHHRLNPRPASASLPSHSPASDNGILSPLDLGSNKRKSELGLEMTKSARIEPVSPGQLHRVMEPSTLGSTVITAEATPITSVVNTALVITETAPTKAQAPDTEFKYVHKLKKAWLNSYVPESDQENGKTCSSSSSLATSPQLTRSTPSPVGSTKSTSSNKGFPSAVKSASEDLKMNGDDHEEEEEEEEEEEFSSDNEGSKRLEKPKPRGRPGPKPKLKPGPKGKPITRKTRSESDNNSDSEKDSDSSKHSKKSDVVGKKRGRKPGPKKKEVEEPKPKKQKPDDSKINEPFVKPTISQLKKSGDSFLQDASCIEVAPKLNKCRECHRESRGSLAQRQKQPMANFFCRFDTFRRLRYTKNGQLAVAGFCDPKEDAQIEDLKLWLPSQDLSPQNMDKETARLILENLAAEFDKIYKAEQEAELYAEELSPAWKRVVQGVREMCDVCEATLFNKHWACGKCGFVVCIDCYRARVNGQPTGVAGTEGENKDKDDFAWLLCNNNKSHQLDTLMLTQIIAGDALEEVNTKLRLLTKLKRSNGTDQKWEAPDDTTRAPVFKDETDVKDEKDEEGDSSTLRDLLTSEQKEEDCLLSLADTDTDLKAMKLEETSKLYRSEHSWLCEGMVLRLKDPEGEDNTELFKTIWKRSQPVIVSGVKDGLEKQLWQPSVLAQIPDHNYDASQPETWAITHGQTIKKFFEGYENPAKRPQSDAGETLSLRFKENWPTQEDHFAELLPSQYKDLMSNLPLSQYTTREGVLNLASTLPDCFVRLDLGPRLWGGYPMATYNLQYNVSDAIHVNVHNQQHKSQQGSVMDILKSSGCDQEFLTAAETNSNKMVALWHVFHPRDAEKIKEFVNKNIKDPKKKPKDPLWIGTMYLKEKLLEKLKTEHNVSPWSFVQCEGEAVIVPSGSPYQVKILNSSMYCQSEFVSPQHMKDSMRLSFSDVLNDDRLQVKNVIFHACKDALSVLEKPSDSSQEK